MSQGKFKEGLLQDILNEKKDNKHSRNDAHQKEYREKIKEPEKIEDYEEPKKEEPKIVIAQPSRNQENRDLKMKKISNKRTLGSEISSEEVKKEAKEKRIVIITKEIQGKQEQNNPHNSQVEKQNNSQVEKTMKNKDLGKTELLNEPSIHYPNLINIETGEIITLNKPIFRIGKDPSYADYILENKYISRKHAEIILKNNTCYIKDKNSSNGTFVNNLKVPPETEMEIKNGQIIKISNIEFKLER